MVPTAVEENGSLGFALGCIIRSEGEKLFESEKSQFRTIFLPLACPYLRSFNLDLLVLNWLGGLCGITIRGLCEWRRMLPIYGQILLSGLPAVHVFRPPESARWTSGRWDIWFGVWVPRLMYFPLDISHKRGGTGEVKFNVAKL